MSDARSDMTPLDEVFAAIACEVSPPAGEPELVPTVEAAGRVLVGEYLSRTDLPPFDKAAMDGYALLPGDPADDFEVLETVGAGEAPTRDLAPGKTVKVMTGAPVPAGTERVVPIERGEEARGRVRLRSRGEALNICPRGEDLSAGDPVLRGPVRLGPLEAANLVSAGHGEVRVRPRVRAAVLNTGDEIVATPAELVPGRIMDANGPLLAALCAEQGLELVERRIVPDDRTATLDALRAAVESADLVLLSGGVSQGDFDYVGRAIEDLGLTVHFVKAAVKPGRPLTFATRPGKTVFGLPGNPVAAFVTFHVFVRRALRLMNGLPAAPRRLTLPLAEPYIRRKRDRREYVPCRLLADGALAPIRYHGSADTMALLAADGLFAVEKGRDRLDAGAAAEFLPTRDMLA